MSLVPGIATNITSADILRRIGSFFSQFTRLPLGQQQALLPQALQLSALSQQLQIEQFVGGVPGIARSFQETRVNLNDIFARVGNVESSISGLVQFRQDAASQLRQREAQMLRLEQRITDLDQVVREALRTIAQIWFRLPGAGAPAPSPLLTQQRSQSIAFSTIASPATVTIMPINTEGSFSVAATPPKTLTNAGHIDPRTGLQTAFPYSDNYNAWAVAVQYVDARKRGTLSQGQIDQLFADPRHEQILRDAAAVMSGSVSPAQLWGVQTPR